MLEFKDQYGPFTRVGSLWFDFSKLVYFRYQKSFDGNNPWLAVRTKDMDDGQTLTGDEIPEFFKKLEEHYADMAEV